MIYDNVLQAMGHTPLVRLNRLSEAHAAQILVKFEGVNVGGSIKTRTALQMIESAERRGEIGPDSIIVEPTSGNQGIGLALVCAVRGYRARIIMPDSVSEERRKLVRHYGAEVLSYMMLAILESAYPNASLWLSVWLARILVFTCHSSSRTGIIY